MATTPKGFTRLTNISEMAGPDQINAAELFVENLIDERFPSVSSLPSSGNWDGRIATVGVVLYLWIDAESAWRKLSRYRLGRNELATATVIAGTPTYTDLATVTATSHGGLCTAEWSVHYQNAASGANRGATFRVTCDGVALAPIAISVDVPLATNLGSVMSYRHESTPVAGAHTWKLQGNATVANAVTVIPALLEIFEN